MGSKSRSLKEKQAAEKIRKLDKAISELTGEYLEAQGPETLEFRERMKLLPHYAIEAATKEIGTPLESLDVSEGPSIVIHRAGGRNPHIGLEIPETTNEEMVARRRAYRKKMKERGNVRAVKNR